MSFKINSKVFLLIVTAILLFAILCDGQNLMKITGKVIDEKGEDFPGVSIRVKGTNTGAITDVIGQFTINAAQNSILIFGAIGYTAEEITVINQQPINISLKISAKDLEQVVVVGYGSQRKVDITGATSSIKGEDLVKQPIMTPTQALQGKLAGVRIIASGKPGSSPTVNIRGMGTALAGTSALFVVDGVLTDDISNINTADIVNIDVLKDASSSAIYGARGANGVVIITTKKGTTGTMKVNYSYTYGIKEATNLVQMANASEYVTYAGESSGKNIVAGSFSTDWYSKILRQANMQQHNFSFSGGTEKNTYFLSIGLLQDEGIVLNNNFKRYTARLNNDFIINKYLKAGLVTSFANSKDKNVDLGSAYNNAYRAAPIIPGFLNNKYGNTSAYQNVGNAILDLNKEDNQTKLNRLQGSGYLTIQPVEWISFRSAIGGDYLISSNKIYSYKFDNDEDTFLSAGGNQRNPNSSLSLTKWNSFRWVWDNIVTLNKKIKDHSLGLTLGTTSEEFIKDDPISGFRKDVPLSANLWYLSAGNANTSTNDSPDPDKWRRESYLSRFNYNFQDKYLFTATVRRDGSSRFSEANRWGIFPSMGVGWVISNESFLQNQNIFETIKLRASWGQVGNDRIPSDAYITTINTGLAYPFGGGIAVPGGAIAQIKDKNLKWETTEELDFGLEYSALKGKLQGEIGFYDKKSRDLLINVKIPSVLGDQDQQVLTNAASIKNTGIEIAANWRDKINNSINYNIGGNISFNKNRVIGLNGGQPILDGGLGAQAYTTKTDNNQPVGSYYVLKTMGVFQTNEEIKAYLKDGNLIQPDATPGDFKYQDSNADGKIDDKDRVFAGTYQPKAIFGANLGLSYKSFDFSIDAYGNIGNKIYNGKRAFRFNDLDNVEQIIVQSRWTPGSGINNQPKANGGNQLASDYFIENGDFVRINNISLAYNLPSKWAKKALIASAKVFVTAQNLITFTKYSGFTPELSNDRPTSAGIELNAYPTNKTIAMGVNIGF